jgi:hypothetical protein
MHFPTCSSHEVRVVEKCGLGAVLYTELDEVRQDPQDGSVPSDISNFEEAAHATCGSPSRLQRIGRCPVVKVFIFPVLSGLMPLLLPTHFLYMYCSMHVALFSSL